MLALSRKTGYSLIALSVLAGHGSSVVPARQIAAETGAPLPVLTNALKDLVRAGIVTSERGACGGYSLAKEPNAVSLHDLITAIEGPFHFVRCVVTDAHTANSTCSLVASCPTRLPARRLHVRLEGFLKSITLAELIDDTDGQPVDATPSMDQPHTGVKEVAE